ncbi:hypothetical protein ABTY53_15670 [Streptomyces noursei]|uniref:hypothetical protein n=1 Tax=Streptomyces noursei TaxID=1971 RepID=UPI00332D213B
MTNVDGFDELISDVETEMSQALIQKRGAVTLMLARIAGTIYTEAVGHGVPHSLAQGMAQDYWTRELFPPGTPTVEAEDGSE